MKLTNKEGLSLSVGVWLAHDEYDHVNTPDYISATGILKPIRMIVLSSRVNAKEVEFDIVDQIPSSMGTSFHEGIERAWEKGYKRSLTLMGYPKDIVDRITLNPTMEQLASIPGIIPVYMEQRRTRKIGKFTIGGKYDFVGDGILEDFKSTGTYGYMNGSKDEEFALQGSIYKWLNPDIITADYMVIQWIFTDWSKLQAMIKEAAGYPQTRVVAQRIKLKSARWIERYMTNKLNLIDSLKMAPQDQIPECTREELWQKDSEIKYYKNPASTGRSTKNYASYADAHQRYLDDGSVGLIKEVKGQAKRCLYCSAFDVCEQKNQLILDGLLEV